MPRAGLDKISYLCKNVRWAIDFAQKSTTLANVC